MNMLKIVLQMSINQSHEHFRHWHNKFQIVSATISLDFLQKSVESVSFKSHKCVCTNAMAYVDI